MMPRSAHRQRGFTYLGLIILVAILGLVGAAGLKMGSLLQRQAAEQELLDIGAQFSDALYSYAAATPPGQPQQPLTLAALLRDPRFPQVRRHLRKLFVDPITGRAEWGLLLQPGSQGIIGVHSLSQAAPLKVGNFEARYAGLEGRAHFSEWHFMVDARASSMQSAGPAIVPEGDQAASTPGVRAQPLFSEPIAPAQERIAPEPVEPSEAQNLPEDSANPVVLP